MITKELRNQKFDSGTPVQQFLYSDNRSGAAQMSIAEKNNLSDETKYRKFSLLVGDIVLGLSKIEDTLPVIQNELGLDQKKAELLLIDIKEFLKPLYDPTWQVPPKQEFSYADNAVSAEEQIISELAETEATIAGLDSIRTMAGDSEQARPEEIVHTSTQSTILK